MSFTSDDLEATARDAIGAFSAGNPGNGESLLRLRADVTRALELADFPRLCLVREFPKRQTAILHCPVCDSDDMSRLRVIDREGATTGVLSFTSYGLPGNRQIRGWFQDPHEDDDAERWMLHDTDPREFTPHYVIAPEGWTVEAW